jgi:L-threonylcarbamoyladenylate synthase
MSIESFESEIAAAADALLKPDGVIVVPTDTTYGVICRLDDAGAVDRIYDIKGRDRSKPLIILGAEIQSLLGWIKGEPDLAFVLAQRFWPGPLTIVAPASKSVPRGILSGGSTVGLRVPAHMATRAVLSRLPHGCAASTSANPSGGGSPSTFDEACRLMSDKVPYVMPDCGEPPAGTESTIVDISTAQPRILRTGSLDPAFVMACINEAVRR